MSKPARILSVFELDLRSLAALRVALGFMIAVDLLNRARAFTAHYTDAGVLPTAVLTGELDRDWQLSLHLLGNEWLVAALFVVAGVAGLMLMVGLWTRVATVVSWVLLVSLHTRNPWVLQGGDDLLRLLVFWGMFLPLGARWSLDAIRAGDRGERPPLIVNMATVALVAQVVFVYAFATLSKLGHRVWWPEGMGVYYALNVEQFTTRLGLVLLGFPGLLKALTYATLILQGLVPVLLLLPLWRERIRALLPLVMIGLHVGFALTMHLGLFSWITCAMWLAFFPPATWAWLGERLPRLRFTASLAAGWERLEARLKKRLAPAAGDGGEQRGDRRRVPLIDRTPVRWLFALLIVYSLWWNLWRADRVIYRMPESVESFGRLLKLDQRWQMFSNPPRWNQWHVVAGVTAGGAELDVWNGGEATMDKPDLVSETFRNQRWRKYLTNLARESGKPHRKHFAAYVCREWNGEHEGDQGIVRVRLYRMRQATPTHPKIERNPPDRVVLGTFDCDA